MQGDSADELGGDPSRPYRSGEGVIDPRSRTAAELRRRLRDEFARLAAGAIDQESLGRVAAIAGELGFTRESGLFGLLSQRSDDANALYEIGYLLVDSGMPALGARFLERCLEAAPEPTVALELGYARLRAGNYRAAEPLLANAFEADTLDDAYTFSAGACLIECRVRAGEWSRAQRALERLERLPGERDEAQIDALSRLVARAARRASAAEGLPDDDRAALFVLTGSILLHQPREVGQALGASLAGLDFLAGLFRRLEAALATVEFTPDVVRCLDPALTPIGAALARRLGVEFRDDRGSFEGALVVVRSTDDLARDPARFQDATNGSLVVALAIDPRRDLPIVPDCVGILAERLVLPWEERIEVTSGGAPDSWVGKRVESRDHTALAKLATELFDAIAVMEGDEDDLAAITSYYRPLRDSLPANRPDDSPQRGSAPSLLPPQERTPNSASG
jgi:tetratricopeptide (TPR) repeat protein